MPPETSYPQETSRDVWRDGWDEATRLIRRCRELWLLSRERKTLHRHEAVLGELCWMQVDFSPASEGRVQAIHQAESQQVRLTNEMAEAAEVHEQRERSLRHQMTGLEERARKYEGERGASKHMLEQTRREIADAESELTAIDTEIGRIESLIASCDQDLQGTRRNAGALADSLTWRAGITDRRRFLENALLGLRQERAPKARRFVLAGNAVEAAQKQLETASSELRAVREELAALSREMAASEKSHRAIKERLTRERNALEIQKTGTYQQVGAEFFDAGIFPRNQPEAYRDVEASRARVAELNDRWETSLRQSAAMPLAGRLMGAAYLVFAGLCLLFLLFLLALVLVSLVQRLA